LKKGIKIKKETLKRRLRPTAVAVTVILVMAGGAAACDSWIAMPDATASGHMILAKTSDVAYYECEPFMRW
jgi:hypothetical protein